MKEIRNAERSGGSPSKRTKVPPHDAQLLPTQGNFQEPEAPATQDGQQQGEGEPTTSTSGHCEMEGEEQSVATEMSPGEDTPLSASHADAPPAATQASGTAPVTRTTSTRRRRRRSPRVTDRQLEVESKALSLIGRVDGDDQFDYFGYMMASICRQMPVERQYQFMSFCLAVAGDFTHAPALPELGELITHFRQALRSHQCHASGAVSTATQTQPLPTPAPYPTPPLPTAGAQFY
ncbi:uncharacterized protein LOC142748292 [Rhinoderma darwinii]|uniref:uncharacterized protein LOC142748292 n=1 Tax=Rhinoderma darwinii TaxID=43563 RepID=UPI003F678482